MSLFENAITKVLHENWREKIDQYFPELKFSDDNFLSLVDYIDNSPQNFYSDQAYHFYFKLLTDLKDSNLELIKQFIAENQNSINRAINAINEINNKPIHDIFLPEGDIELYQFIEKDIHYNYLKLLEGPYFLYTLLIAKKTRIKRGKGIEGLDLYNCIQEIENQVPFLTQVYDNTIRNGIAHGSVIFQDYNLVYNDKKGNTKKTSKKDIVKTFDSLLDICNGLTLGFQAFIFSNLDFFNNNSIQIPQSIIIRELKFQVDGPAWKVLATSESRTFDDRSQLVVYVKNSFMDYNKVQFNSFRTAYLALRFTANYDRIFLQLNSKYSKFGKSDWAAFDGLKMKENIRLNSPMESYKGVLENNGIMFLPKIKMPKIIYKIGTLIMSINVIMPLAYKNYIKNIFPKPFIIRDTRIHSKGRFSVVEDPCVVIKKEFRHDLETLVRSNQRKIVKQVKRHSRKQCSLFSILRYLPIKYLRVFVYESDFRVRRLRNSGLIPQLICTIEVNTSKKIKTNDIVGGIIEIHGKYRIVWNSKWKPNQFK